MNRPWMPLYVADYLADTLDLGAEESGVYLLMLMIAWRRPDGALPNDMVWLKRSLASCVRDMHGNRFNRIVPKILERYFELGPDDKFRNKRLTNEREKAEKFSEKQKQIAQKRWSKTNENNGIADANAMPLQSQSHTQHISSLRSDTRARELVPRATPEPSSDWPTNAFEQFWDAYPHKVGKQAALKAFTAARRKAVPWARVMAALHRYIAEKPADRAWCNPATWLNQGRWDDEPAAVQATGPPRRAQPTFREIADQLGGYDETARTQGEHHGGGEFDFGAAARVR